MLTQSLKNMRKYQLAHDSQKHKMVYEVTTSFIKTLLSDDSICPVLMSTQRIKTDISSLSVPFAFIVYSKWTLLHRKYSELLGLLDIFTEAAQQGNFLLPQIYFAIFRAISPHRPENF